MKAFNIYRKRDGQSFELKGSTYSSSFEDAKKEFAKNCYNDLLNGKHGDNYVALTVEEDGVEEDGIYYNDGGQELSELDCFFPDSLLEEGIEMFNEDVYTWELRDSVTFNIYDEDGELYVTEEFENLEAAQSNYPLEDGFTVKTK